MTDLVATLDHHDFARCRIEKLGTDRPLKPYVTEELFFIAKEALLNAVQHAEAARITITLNFGHRIFSLACSDNGVGMRFDGAFPDGHYGIIGMAERAKKLGANFTCKPNLKEGTLITVQLPSKRAYLRTGLLPRILQGLGFGP